VYEWKGRAEARGGVSSARLAREEDEMDSEMRGGVARTGECVVAMVYFRPKVTLTMKVALHLCVEGKSGSAGRGIIGPTRTALAQRTTYRNRQTD
jgi:hypothetical protein